MDKKFREKVKKNSREMMRERYQNDPVWRECIIKKNKQYYHTDEAYREKSKKRFRDHWNNRYHNDPLFRKHHLEKARERRQKMQQLK